MGRFKEDMNVVGARKDDVEDRVTETFDSLVVTPNRKSQKEKKIRT